jgi:ParB family chromosome partitioning protein
VSVLHQSAPLMVAPRLSHGERDRATTLSQSSERSIIMKKPTKPGKAGKKLAGSQGSISALLYDPEDLVIVTDPKHPLFDERTELELEESFILNIQNFGCIEPVVVSRDTETGKILVVAGRQRVKAAREANKRLKKLGKSTIQVPVILKRGLDAGDLMGIMVSENEQRTDDDVMVKAKKMQRYLDLGRSAEQAAVLWGVSVSSIKNTVGLLDSSKPLRKALREGKVKASAAYKLARMSPEEQKKKVEEIEAAQSESIKKDGKDDKKKTREIVEGRPQLRGKKEVEECLVMIESVNEISGQDRQIAVWVLRWMLGEETLARFVGAARETGT